PQVQQEVFRLLIDHVVVGENEIVIKHIVPTDDDCRLKPGRRYIRIQEWEYRSLGSSIIFVAAIFVHIIQ
ncbi:MAG: hypothetical protein ACOYYJ_09135, partial [Chloroflexota bacterium]